METLAKDGLQKLFELGAVVVILLFVVGGLVWFISILLKDAKSERQLNREALTNNTKVMTELTQVIQNAIHK